MRKTTKIEQQLINRLFKVWNNQEFVTGILVYLEDDDERQAIIDYIDNNKSVGDEELVLLALQIDRMRNSQNENVTIDSFFKDLEPLAAKLNEG